MGLTLYVLIGLTYMLIKSHTINVSTFNVAYYIFAYPYDVIKELLKPAHWRITRKEKYERQKHAEEKFIESLKK